MAPPEPEQTSSPKFGSPKFGPPKLGGADAVGMWLRYAAHAYGENLPLAPPIAVPPASVTPVLGTGTPANRPPVPHPPADVPGAEAPRAHSSGAQAPMAEDMPAAPPRVGSPADLLGKSTELPPARPLPEIAAEIAACIGCKLCTQRTHTVPGEGPAHAEVMFIGEAPGAREDATGRPFVGPAGDLLEKIIENAMGLRRSDAFIANINKCRPPNNRNPEPDEVAACMPFLREQIRAVQPRVLVTLGKVAASNLLGGPPEVGGDPSLRDLPLARLRGRELAYEGIPVVATWHPAYLLRNPAAKRDTWEDIKRVNRMLGRPEDPRQG